MVVFINQSIVLETNCTVASKFVNTSVFVSLTRWKAYQCFSFQGGLPFCILNSFFPTVPLISIINKAYKSFSSVIAPVWIYFMWENLHASTLARNNGRQDTKFTLCKHWRNVTFYEYFSTLHWFLLDKYNMQPGLTN